MKKKEKNQYFFLILLYLPKDPPYIEIEIFEKFSIFSTKMRVTNSYQFIQCNFEYNSLILNQVCIGRQSSPVLTEKESMMRSF